MVSLLQVVGVINGKKCWTLWLHIRKCWLTKRDVINGIGGGFHLVTTRVCFVAGE